jgi:hypothetical protein
MGKNWHPCPTPGKHRFRDELAARAALVDVVMRRNRGRQGHDERRIYECRCGGWHLTSKPRRRDTPT